MSREGISNLLLHTLLIFLEILKQFQQIKVTTSKQMAFLHTETIYV